MEVKSIGMIRGEASPHARMTSQHMGTPLGLRGGALVHVDDVERGKACKCQCPACGADLIAKKGSKNAHHFAHVSADCGAGAQTALHMFAKDVIASAGELLLPAVVFKKRSTSRAWPVHEMQRIRADEVRLEARVGRMVPDVLLTVKGQQLLVEVCVTHAVDDIKLAKIRDHKVSALEITLGHLPRELPLEQLRNAILYDETNREWLHNRAERKAGARLLEASRRLPHQRRHLDLVVNGCPLRGDTAHEEYVNVVQECRHCDYCLDDGVGDSDAGTVLCLGHTGSSTFAELKAQPRGSATHDA